MIDAIEAYNMMPSVMNDEKTKQELLKMVENKIIEAAKQNESSVTIQTSPYNFNLICKELEKHHYRWVNLSQFETVREYLDYKEHRGDPCIFYAPRYNSKNHNYEFFYCIDWNF